MNLFKAMSMKMADSLDWNCKKVCKRSKGDTKRIHKQARNKIKQEDKKEINKIVRNIYTDEMIINDYRGNKNNEKNVFN